MFSLFSNRKSDSRNQAGDTIVEVVIAIAIIASILAGAFVVANRSSRDIRDSQEHSEALQLLQGQVELLRAAVSANGFTTPGSPFCFIAGNATAQAAGTPACTETTYNRYAFSITPPDVKGTYTLSAQWVSVTGTQARVQLFYRVPPSS